MINLRSLKMMKSQYQRMYDNSELGSDEELKYLGALELLEALIEDYEYDYGVDYE